MTRAKESIFGPLNARDNGVVLGMSMGTEDGTTLAVHKKNGSK